MGEAEKPAGLLTPQPASFANADDDHACMACMARADRLGVDQSFVLGCVLTNASCFGGVVAFCPEHKEMLMVLSAELGDLRIVGSAGALGKGEVS